MRPAGLMGVFARGYTGGGGREKAREGRKWHGGRRVAGRGKGRGLRLILLFFPRG